MLSSGTPPASATYGKRRSELMKWPGFPKTWRASGHGLSGLRACILSGTVSSMLAMAQVAAVATASAAGTPAPALRKSRMDFTEISSSISFRDWKASDWRLPAGAPAATTIDGLAGCITITGGDGAAGGTAPGRGAESSVSIAWICCRRRPSSCASSSSTPSLGRRPAAG